MSSDQAQTNHQNGNGSASGDGEKKVFIGGLSGDIKEEQIREYFSQYGEVSNVDIKTDMHTGLCRGYGFLTFTDSAPVTELLSANKDHYIANKKIDVKKVAKKNRLDYKIFVGGITQDMTEEDIRAFFSQFGTITEFEQPFDKARNMKKNFCFISFENLEDVKYALNSPKQTINGKVVDVKTVIFNPETMTKTGRRPKVVQPFANPYYGYDAATAAANYLHPSAAYEAYGPAYGGYDYNALGYDASALGYPSAATHPMQNYQRGGRFKDNRYRYTPY